MVRYILSESWQREIWRVFLQDFNVFFLTPYIRIGNERYWLSFRGSSGKLAECFDIRNLWSPMTCYWVIVFVSFFILNHILIWFALQSQWPSYIFIQFSITWEIVTLLPVESHHEFGFYLRFDSWSAVIASTYIW